MIRSLRIFCDLVDIRSFTEAAQRNFLTQSAVSQHLKALEEKFGHRLLERGRGRFRLTPAGQRVYEAGRALLRRYERLERALKEPLEEVAGVLRVAAVYSAGLYDLQPYTIQFLKRHPKVTLQLRYLTSPEVYTSVLSGRTDLGIVDYPKPHPHLHLRIFKQEDLVVVIPSDHPWAPRRRIRIQQLHRQPFIAVHPGLPMREALDTTLRKAGVQVEIVNAFDNIEIVKRAVEVGLGISIAPPAAVANEVRAGTLKQLQLPGHRFERSTGLLIPRGKELPYPARKFVEVVLGKEPEAR